MNEEYVYPANSLEAGEDEIEQPSELPGKENIIGLAIVGCAGELFGIDLKWVREIRPFNGATFVYGLPAYWVGVTALRGHLYAVLDLQQFLFPGQTTNGNRPQILYTAIPHLSIGLLIEGIPTVRQIDYQSVTDTSTFDMPYIVGKTPNQITVLDLPGLFADPRLAAPASQTIEDAL